MKDVKIVRGKWHHGKNPSIPNEIQQTDEDRTIEHKWKRYIETKQIKKAERKQKELMLQGLNGAQRIKHMEPINDLIENIKRDAKRFNEKVLVAQNYKKEPKPKEQKPVVFVRAPEPSEA